MTAIQAGRAPELAPPTGPTAAALYYDLIALPAAAYADLMERVEAKRTMLTAARIAQRGMAG